MKIGIIADLLQLPLDQTIEAAAQFNIQGIQMYAHGRRWNLCNLDDKQLAQMRADCERKNLEFTALCGDLGGHAFENAAENQDRIAKVKRIIDVAHILGAPVITGHIGVVLPDRTNVKRRNMQTALYEVGNYAFENGIFFAIETGPELPETLRDFIKEINSPGIKVNLDPANIKMVLNYSPIKAVEILMPYIVHSHAKDGHHVKKCDPAKIYDAFAEGGFVKLLAETGELFHELPLGRGDIDWKEYLKALKNGGYDGYLTVEREVGVNPFAEIKYAVEFLRTQLAAL